MTKDLIENLNSSYFEAFSALSSKDEPKKILVYVESDDDISFWRNILNKYESKNIVFDINLPTKENYEKGKHNLLKNFKENLGPYLIICVDSDYDYLLQHSTINSQLLNNNKYIFQTYTYSIENFLCYSTSLKSLCVDTTKVDQINIDFENIITTYSSTIYKLLIWSIYFHKINNHEIFTISNFCDSSKLLTNNDIDNDFKEDLETLKNNINQKVAEIEKTHSEQIEEKKIIEQEINNLGLTDNNCYLFAQGHLILENFILMILKPVCNKLKSNKIKIIRESCSHNTQITNEINSYRNKTIDIEKAIQMNYKFYDSELYQKIIIDLDNYVLNFI